MSTISRAKVLVATAAVTLCMTACSSPAQPATTPAAPQTPSGGPSIVAANLPTHTPGKLTIATGQPAYSPWVEDDKPESGKGFESAVAYAVAEQLGFSKDDVVWARTTFDAAVTPGPKDWDLNIQQFSITDQRKKAVDFSTPYYTTNQAIVALTGSPAIGAKSLADLAGVNFGVQVGTTSLQAVTDIIKPTAQPKIFNSSDDVVAALRNKQVEAIVVDLPTAFYLTSAEFDNGTIVGQLDSSAGGDDFGFVLPKGSPLTAPVSAAVDALRANGTLAQLQQTWLSESTNVPVLK